MAVLSVRRRENTAPRTPNGGVAFMTNAAIAQGMPTSRPRHDSSMTVAFVK